MRNADFAFKDSIADSLESGGNSDSISIGLINGLAAGGRSVSFPVSFCGDSSSATGMVFSSVRGFINDSVSSLSGGRSIAISIGVISGSSPIGGRSISNDSDKGRSGNGSAASVHGSSPIGGKSVIISDNSDGISSPAKGNPAATVSSSELIDISSIGGRFSIISNGPDESDNISSPRTGRSGMMSVSSGRISVSA